MFSIAIIGIGCRFPGGASSPQDLWEKLCQGFDGICEIPDDRWDIRRFYDSDPAIAGKMVVKMGGFLQQKLDTFDAGFFNLSPREADCLDPQQRLLLEVSWEAMEDGGIVPSLLKGSRTGVFIGGFTTDWLTLNNQPDNLMLGDLYTAINSTQTVLSARLAHFFDLKGPCLTVDTACSSSLVAVHLACQSLLNGECGMALAGGVNAILTPQTSIGMSKGRFLNSEGQCRAFDADAKGYVRGEGAGVVILKPLQQAIQEGDAIYAIIRATGVNHDGHTNGLALPNREAQKELIGAVLKQAQIAPSDIQYVEAHGTGTLAGDPSEAWAIDQVLNQEARPKRCLIGSIKTNIGHLEAAAGVAGLIKAALSLKQRKIPPNLHFAKPNPAILFQQNCLEVPVALREFPQPEKELFAGVNSFGYGGTNAHVVLQEYKEECVKQNKTLPRLLPFPFSARSQEALREQIQNAIAVLENQQDVADLGHTLCKRREQHRFGACIIAKTREQLLQRLIDFSHQGEGPYTLVGEPTDIPKDLTFVYTGMGPQWWGMGRELCAEESVFRETIEACDRALQPLAKWSLLEELARDENFSKMDQPEYSQPANFAIQAALTTLLKSWGIVPAAVVGHSIGEVAAAFAAQAITLEEGMLISFHRSRVQAIRKDLGTMLAAEISQEQAMECLACYPGKLSLAAINAPATITLSGEQPALQSIADDLEKQGIFNRFLKVNIAYHSHQLDGLEEELRQSLSTLIPKAPQLPFYSTVTGKRCSDHLNASYWWQNVRQPVRFHQAMLDLIGNGCSRFIEIGPHPVLSKAIKENLQHQKKKGLSFYTLNRKEGEQEALARLIARLHLSGVALDWDRLAATGNLIKLPAYPWQRKRHWIESETSRQYRLSLRDHPMLARSCQSPEEAWTVEVNRHFFPWLEDHQIDHSVVFPGAAYAEAGLALHRQHSGDESCLLENLDFSQAFVISQGTEPLLRLSSNSPGFQIHSKSNRNGGEWTLHAKGTFHPLWKGYLPNPLPMEELRLKCRQEVPAQEIYRQFAGSGLHYGPSFQLIHQLHKGQGEALAELHLPEMAVDYLLYPPLLDAALQTLIGTKEGGQFQNLLLLPVRIGQLHYFSKPKGKVWCYAKAGSHTNRNFSGDIFLCDDEGRLFAELRQVTCRLFTRKQTSLQATVDRLGYQLIWEEISPIKAEPKPWRVVCPINMPAGDCSTDNILYIWPAGVQTDHDPTIELLALIQQMSDRPFSLIIATQGVQTVHPGEASYSPNASTLWGLGRVLRQEFPSCHCLLADLDPAKPIAESLQLLLSMEINTHEIAIRNDKFYALKLVKERYFEPEPVLSPSSNVCLEMAQTGSIDHLRFRQTQRRPPKAGEVEICTHTASLNFKDLMKVMGMLDDNVLEGTYFGSSFGMECSGTVTALGKGVRSLKVGDKVCAFAPNSFRSYVTLPADAVCPIPPGTSLDEAPIYIPFMTVVRGLKEIAQLKKGETLLIHTATGAVGLAAVQYAQHVGATIIATAGSPEKRSWLESLEIAHVADSRSLHFSRQVLEWTEGKGVDVVLNALAGEALLKSWSLLASYGRFIEIGKRDISQNASLPMEVFNRNTLFAAIDLDRTFVEDKQIIRRLLRETMRGFELGFFKPLPSQAFSLAQVQESFHFLARAKHLGKVTLCFAGETVDALPLEGQTLFRDQASYLITGGLRGFGLSLAKWMAEKGARHLILMSRQGASSEEALNAVEELKTQGIQVKAIAADVGDPELSQVIKSALKNFPALKGIFHCAMVLDDGFLAQLDAQRFQSVLRPKVSGCWNLHHATQEMQLDHFVLFSSISALIGNPGQASYAAANAFLDAFAHYRRNLGLRGLSINWGALGEAGVVARSQALASHLASSGIAPISTQQAFQMLEYLLKRPSINQYGIFDLDWPRLLSSLPELKKDARFAHFLQNQGEAALSDFHRSLLCLDQDTQLQALIQFIRDKVAHTLKIEKDKVATNARLNTLGMDSLMAMELQHAMEQTLPVKIPTMELMKSPSIEELSAKMQQLLD
ncbi:MAG: type I polyketide synthase [Parachlamydia sp.]|nr:type I polyketide synthase [Parachlamydia sp.]